MTTQHSTPISTPADLSALGAMVAGNTLQGLDRNALIALVPDDLKAALEVKPFKDPTTLKASRVKIIHIVLDNTWSVQDSGLTTAMRLGYNSMVADLQADEANQGRAIVYTWFFGEGLKPIQSGVMVKDLVPLDENVYNPNDNETRLFDCTAAVVLHALADSLELVKANKPNTEVIALISDGKNTTRSRNISAAQLKRVIEVMYDARGEAAKVRLVLCMPGISMATAKEVAEEMGIRNVVDAEINIAAAFAEVSQELNA